MGVIVLMLPTLSLFTLEKSLYSSGFKIKDAVNWGCQAYERNESDTTRAGEVID